MKIINAYAAILGYDPDACKKIERAGRICYKSESRITDESADKFVRNIILNGHEAMLEHASMTALFVVDRGVSHELVRHRMASFAQESSRYCNYSKDQFGNEITFIRPYFLDNSSGAFNSWSRAMVECEDAYFMMLKQGCTPEQARSVLPNSLKTEVIVTANFREWRHIFKLRAAGVTGKPHPQMLEVMIPLLDQTKALFPAVFDDIQPYKMKESE